MFETVLPDGEYTGLFFGHEMRFAVQSSPPHGPMNSVCVTTDLGVRGINLPHTFMVVDGRIDESTIEPVEVNDENL